jgi:hypothetical protein
MRLGSGGLRTERMPGLDYLVAAFARAGLFQLSVGQVAPITDQANTAWFKPALQSWSEEGVLYLWDAAVGEYALATLSLWQALLGGTNATPTVVQDVTGAGPVNVLTNASVVRVNQLVSAPITLTVPLSDLKTCDVLISDWKGVSGNGNPITVNLTGGDKFPGGVSTWSIEGNTGSIFLRRVPGGYAL